MRLVGWQGLRTLSPQTPFHSKESAASMHDAFGQFVEVIATQDNSGIKVAMVHHHINWPEKYLVHMSNAHILHACVHSIGVAVFQCVCYRHGVKQSISVHPWAHLHKTRTC